MLRRIFTVLFFKVSPIPEATSHFFSLYISFSSSCFVHFAVYMPYLHCQTPSSRGWFLSVLLFFNLLVHVRFSTLAPLTPWPDNSLFGAPVLCIVGYLASFWASTHWMPGEFFVVTIKSVSRLSPGGQKWSQLRTIASEFFAQSKCYPFVYYINSIANFD